MSTDLEIDQELLSEAMEISKLPTPTATVNEALRELVQHRKQWKVLDLFGKIDFDPTYDYKEERRRDN